MADVRLENVVKRFGKVVAVDHVNLHVKDGEFFILLGPSGCGKTTTLRIIAGLEYPDEGRVYIGGKDVTDLEPMDRDVAMVFQNYALYPHMTVYENIAFPLKIRRKKLGLTKEEIDERVHEVAKMLHIEELLDRKPGQLSGGQQQRVALARALVRRPKVWLMDEPLSNLDALLRVVMRAELKKLQKQLGITTIYVTHDQAEAMSMADRIAVMNKGRIMQVGTPHEVYYKPAHVFVATFIGNPPANILECRVTQDGDKIILECPGHREEIRDPELADAVRRAGVREIYLGMRPEHIKILKHPEPGTFKGKVYVVEPLGSEQIVDVTIDGTVVKVKAPPTLSLQPGETVYLKPEDWKKVMVFDKKTGKALKGATP
ncbi:MAG: ABC transporter ATP-binding protein [Crenarchaeota archaeon]|nr:ABC transporter ATP-binding protein [Thermoproteota archaeon]